MRALTPLAGILLAAAAAHAADGKAPLSPETLWQIHRLAAPAVSPDGAWAVVAVTAYDMKDDKGQADLWLVPTAGGEARQLTSLDSSETGPVWSPDGLHLTYSAGGRLVEAPIGGETAPVFLDSAPGNGAGVP